MQIPGVFVDVIQPKDNHKPALSLTAKLTGASNAVSHSRQQRKHLQLKQQPAEDSQQKTDSLISEVAFEEQGMPQINGRMGDGNSGRGNSSASGVHGNLGTAKQQPAATKAGQLASLLQSAVLPQPKPASATLQDLCPEDKEKVAKLLKQVVDLGQELQTAKAERSNEVQRLSNCNQELVQENIGLKSKLGQVVGLIKAYHHRLQAMEAITATLRAQVQSQQQQQAPLNCQAPGDAAAPEQQAPVPGKELSARVDMPAQTLAVVNSNSTHPAQSGMTAGPGSEPQPQPLVTIPAGANISITIQHTAPTTSQPGSQPSGHIQQAGVQAEQCTGKRDQEVQAGASQPGRVQTTLYDVRLQGDRSDSPQDQVGQASSDSLPGTGVPLTPDGGHNVSGTHTRLNMAGPAAPASKQLPPGADDSAALAVHGPKVVDARAAAAGTAVDVPVQDLHVTVAEAVPASPLLVHPEGDVAEAAASLLRWQAQQGLLPQEELEHMGAAKGRVLRYDPAIGKHGAFYFADVPDMGSIPVAAAAPGLGTSAHARLLQSSAPQGPQVSRHHSAGVQGGLHQEDQDDAETLSDLASELTLLSLGSPAQHLAGLSPLSHHSSHARRALYRGHEEGQPRVHGRSSGGSRGGLRAPIQSMPLHARVEARLQELRMAAAAAVRALPDEAAAADEGQRTAELRRFPVHAQPSNPATTAPRVLRHASPPQAGADAAEAACARAAARAAQALLEEDSQDEEGVRTAQVLLAGAEQGNSARVAVEVLANLERASHAAAATRLASPLSVMPASSNESGAPNSHQVPSYSSAHDRQQPGLALHSQTRAAGVQHRRGTVDSSDEDVRDTAGSKAVMAGQPVYQPSAPVLTDLTSNPLHHLSSWPSSVQDRVPAHKLQGENGPGAAAVPQHHINHAAARSQQGPGVNSRAPRAASRLLSPERLLHALGSQPRMAGAGGVQRPMPMCGPAAAPPLSAWAADDEDILARTGFEESLVDLLQEVDVIEQQLRGDTAQPLDNARGATMRPAHAGTQSHKASSAPASGQRYPATAQQQVQQQKLQQDLSWRGSRYGPPPAHTSEPVGRLQDDQLRTSRGLTHTSMARIQPTGAQAGSGHGTGLSSLGPRLSVEDWLESNVYEENDVVMSILEQEAGA